MLVTTTFFDTAIAHTTAAVALDAIGGCYSHAHACRTVEACRGLPLRGLGKGKAHAGWQGWLTLISNRCTEIQRGRKLCR